MKTIPLNQGKVALVDDSEFEQLSRFRWFVVKSRSKHHVRWYAKRNPTIANHNRIVVLMHRQILGLEPGTYCDHRNHNGLDNRRENLRPATRAQNNGNQRKAPGTSSRYKGVSWNKNASKWIANIKINGRSKYLGYFTTEQAAAAAYDRAALIHFGEFALTNGMLKT